ncbi:MAG: helix-turn-helix domain-containing protein [Bacteroidota bacterium]
MVLKIIRSKKEYAVALQRFEQIFQAKMGTPESDEADVLALLIKNYEDNRFPIDTPDPLSAIQYRMEQQGMSKQDLAGILGYKSRVTDLFNGHRKLNLGMIRKLHTHLNISFETLVKEY